MSILSTKYLDTLSRLLRRCDDPFILLPTKRKVISSLNQDVARKAYQPFKFGEGMVGLLHNRI